MGDFERYEPCGSEEDDIYFGGPDYETAGRGVEEHDPELWHGYEGCTPPPVDEEHARG